MTSKRKGLSGFLQVFGIPLVIVCIAIALWMALSASINSEYGKVDNFSVEKVPAECPESIELHLYDRIAVDSLKVFAHVMPYGEIDVKVLDEGNIGRDFTLKHGSMLHIVYKPDKKGWAKHEYLYVVSEPLDVTRICHWVTKPK